jgi:diaminopimelate decarboxylase
MNRLNLFPDTARVENGSLTIAGRSLHLLAGQYGTPLYLYDRATMDNAVADYRSALGRHYPARADITYAGKAFLCTAIAQWTQQNDLWLDCTGEGEIAIAKAGGAAREKIVVHGVNKSEDDLKSALRNAGTIVVDNLPELERIHAILGEATLAPRASAGENLPGVTRDSSIASLSQNDINLWLRLLPGLAVQTHHAHTQTGQHTSKFGMNVEELMEAAVLCRQMNLPLNGIHFHQGSQFRDPSPLVDATQLALDVAKETGFAGEWHFSPGGGWGMAYHEDELPHPNINEYVRVISEEVVKGCQARGLTMPILHIEPGRSLVARAGVAVYRVGAVKRHGNVTWLLTDGGMADNPRHALYGARYSCLTVAGADRERSEKVHIAGPFCESGDVILEDLPMPKVEEGELIAVPVSGAYQLSMSSNYNGARRPAVVWLEEGKTRLIVKRETTDDLLRRDQPLG